MTLDVTWFTDPSCPFAYSATPAHAVLRWRYGDQLSWRLVTIGLREDRGPASPPAAPADWYFARYGMPYTAPARTERPASGRACRAIVATRLRAPGREAEVHRALQLAWFTTDLMLDEDEAIARALRVVDGLDVEEVVRSLDAADVAEAYAADRDEARSAAGGATEAQGRAATAEDGRVRFTAPSLVFARGDRVLEAGGFQPLEAYDVCIANLAPELDRRPPAGDALEALVASEAGLAAAEVAALCAERNAACDLAAVDAALEELRIAGRAERRGPLWRAIGAGG